VIISTISAGIVAVIATIFWSWKKRRDLRFEAERQRQQHRIAEEFEQAKRQQELQERRDRLSRERDGFAEGATGATRCQELAQLWENFLAWMEMNDLQHLPKNQTMFVTRRDWNINLRKSEPVHLQLLANEMVGLIRNSGSTLTRPRQGPTKVQRCQLQ
jgi:hypothetical protein